MKIDLSPPTLDREPALKTAPRGDDTRRDQGRAFDAAIRDAKPPQRDDVKSGSASSTAPQEAATPPSQDTKPSAGEATGAAKAQNGKDKSKPQDQDSKEAGAADGGEGRTLQSLLGLLTQPAAAATAEKAPSSEEGEATRMLVPDGDAQLLEAEGGEGAGGKSVRLEVLKMETHFEPHQDGMVLVQPGSADKAQKAAGETGAKQATKDAAAGSVLAELAEKAAKTVADVASAGERGATKAVSASERGTEKTASVSGDAAKEGDAALPLRFDEALARLSDRGRADADEGRSDRRGEGQKSAVADVASRGSDATATGSSKAGLVDATQATGGAAGLGLANQIADRMLEVLGEPAARPSSAATPDNEAHLRMRAGGAALKTLTIQLKPEHLGTLDVSMRLSEGRLTVELAASRADTAVLLAEDRGALRQLLERAGFSLDDAAISVVAKDIQPNATRAADSSAMAGGGNDGSGSNASSGQMAREGGSTRDEQGGARRQPDQASRGSLPREEAPARNRTATYL